MAYGLYESSALEVCIERTLNVEAALGARPELKALAPAWLERASRLKGLRDARDEARHRLGRASAILSVVAVTWADEITALFNEVRHLSDHQLRTALFGERTARELKVYGTERALEFSEVLSQRLPYLDHPRLNPHCEPLAAANQALRQSLAAREAAKTALWSHNLARTDAVAELLEALKQLEAQVLLIAPGNRALVRAALAVAKA